MTETMIEANEYGVLCDRAPLSHSLSLTQPIELTALPNQKARARAWHRVGSTHRRSGSGARPSDCPRYLSWEFIVCPAHKLATV